MGSQCFYKKINFIKTTDEILKSGDHGHLGYYDEKIWGYYIFPTLEGVSVTIYLNKKPLCIDGTRGESMPVEIKLDKEYLEILLEKTKKGMAEYENWSKFPDTNGYEDSIEILEEAIKISEDFSSIKNSPILNSELKILKAKKKQ